MLSRRHARISLQGFLIQLENLSKSGTRVDQRGLVEGESAILSGGERVWLGPRTMVTVRLLGLEALPDAADVQLPAATRQQSAVAAAIYSDSPEIEDGIPLILETLGGFQVVVNGATLPNNVWDTRKSILLLLSLADNFGRTVSVMRLLDRLWPDTAGFSDRNVLQTAVSRLRKALLTAGKSLPDPVEHERGGYRLNPAYRLHYDVREFERMCKASEAVGDPLQRVALLEQAITVARGPFLEDFTDEWVRIRRLEINNLYFSAIDTLARLREQQGRLDDAVRLFTAALERDPYREEGQLGLMRSLAASGRQDEAMRHYHDYAHALKKSLGEAPSPQLQQLYESLLHPNSGTPD